MDKTELNKALVAGFLDEVLKSGDYGRLTDFISSEAFIQHNPWIGDGLAGLGVYVDSLAEQGLSMVYDEIHHVIGSGSFVASLARADVAGTDTAMIDLFRVDDGRIVEHWDVMEAIAPESEWVNFGKF